MELTIFLAKFWGSLFMILGALSVGAKLLGRIIEYTEDKTITISTGYITFLLGLATVVAHNVWVADWPVAITLLGWITLFKGIEKIGFPDRVNKKAKMFKGQAALWGVVIFLIGAFIFWIGLSVTDSKESSQIVGAEQEIQDFLAGKYNKPVNEVTVNITKQTKNHVAGGVKFGPASSAGGMFLAVRSGNGWEVVYDGNGSVDCEKMRIEYNFPDEILKPNFCD